HFWPRIRSSSWWPCSRSCAGDSATASRNPLRTCCIRSSAAKPSTRQRISSKPPCGARATWPGCGRSGSCPASGSPGCPWPACRWPRPGSDSHSGSAATTGGAKARQGRWRMDRHEGWTRREVLSAGLAAALAPVLAGGSETMITRRIPVSGEALPVIGLGTWQVFDVPSTPAALEAPRRIVDLLVEAGGRLIDSSPMYGRAEQVVGEVIAAGADRDRLFLATKVWTDGRTSGERQMQRSFQLMRTDVMDLMQVHNRRDLDTHMDTIREWQAQKRIRYSGVTDYRESVLEEMEAVMREHRPDFIQINYSLGEHGADDRVLPLAQDLGIAVIVN